MPARGVRSDYRPDSDCEIIRVISRKRAPRTNSGRKQQQPPRPKPIKVEDNKPQGRSNTGQKRGSQPIPTPTPTSFSSSDSAARNAPSPSSTSRATAKMPMISPPVTPARPKPVPRLDLTHLLSSDDDLDDSDGDASGVEIIDADIFKRAVSQKHTPRLFRDRGQHHYATCSRPRSSTPILLTGSSSEDSDSEHKMEQSPSLRYSRGGSSAPATARRCFERSKSPSPEDRREERPRTVRTSTAPPPEFFERPDQTQREEGTHCSKTPYLKSLQTDSNKASRDTPQPASTTRRIRIDEVKQVKQETSPGKTTPPLGPVKGETPKSCRPVKPLKDAQLVAGSQRPSSLPPTGDLPIAISFTPTNRRASAARKAPAAPVKPKSSPANPSPGSLTNTKTSIRPNAADIAIRVSPILEQSENIPHGHQSLPASPEDQALIQARALPPRSPYQFSRALRPTIDRLKEGIRSGRVSVPPGKQELRVTGAGRRAITAEMEHRGITSLASYNEFQTDLMREYTRLLFRSSVPHISMMTFSMNELQDECLEIEARRPARERTSRTVVKREQPSAIDLKDIFPESDTSSDDFSDESEGVPSGQHHDTLRDIFRGIKTENVKPEVIEQESLRRTKIPSIGLQSLAGSPGEKQLCDRGQYPPPRNQQFPTPSRQKPSLFKTPDPQRRVSMISRGTQTDESIMPGPRKKRHLQNIQDTSPPPSKKRRGNASKRPSPSPKKEASLAKRWDLKRITPARGTSGMKRKTENGKCK